MELNLFGIVRTHLAILTKKDKKHFLLLSLSFFITSIFDILGIGSIGFFLVLMMRPEILFNTFLGHIISKDVSINHILTGLGIIILGLFLLKTFLGYLIQKELVTYCFKVSARIRLQLMEQYIYAPYSFFTTHHTSEIINHLMHYTSSYANQSLASLMILLIHSIFVCGIICFLLVMHPFTTLLLILMILTMVFTHLHIVKNKLYLAGQNINKSNQQIVKSVQESLLGLKEVRILSKEQFFLDQINIASVENITASGLISVYQKLPLYLLESIMFIFIITLCIVELMLGINVQSIIALCGMLVAAAVRLIPSLYQIAVAAVSLQSSKHSLKVIFENLFHLQDNFKGETFWPKNSPVLVDKSDSFHEIKFENVYYAYPNVKTNCLSSVNLRIKKGQSIGIIGPSGAGKTTLIDLLLGLLTPTEGKILLDGKEITDKKNWVGKFAYIPQIIHLLDASIQENIVFGQSENSIDKEKLRKAIQMAQLEEVVSNLPNGLDTMIGENGIRLSGGQRQRLALARAFYYERDIVVMDEATAALDNETEREVVEAIKHLHQLKTLVIIAHRYTTVQHCDIIYRLNQGRIVESGTYNEVITLNKKILPNYIGA